MKKIALGFMVAMAFLSVGGCKKKGSGAAGEAIAKMSEFADNMCACKDATCAKKVSDDLNKWTQEQSKTQKEPPTLNAADTKKTQEIGVRLTECTQKAMTPAAPAEGSAAPAEGSAAAPAAEGSAAAPAAGPAEGSAAAPAAGSAK